MSVPSSDSYTFDSSVRGYHIYRTRLVVAVQKTLTCRKERGNVHDVYAVAVVEGDVIVGHVPRSISAVCYLFIDKGGTISCEITGSYRYTLVIYHRVALNSLANLPFLDQPKCWGKFAIFYRMLRCFFPNMVQLNFPPWQ